MELEILVVDDKQTDADAVAEILSELANVTVTTMTDPEKALELISRRPDRFAIILQDLNMNLKNLDGIGLAKKVWKINPAQIIAIFSGEEHVDALIKCVGTPIVEFIKKGSAATVTQKKVLNLLQKYAATRTTFNVSELSNEYKSACDSVGLVSRSPLMAAAVANLKKIAASNATLLIRGGSGTGKELVARATHNLSPRKSGTFIGLNMGAIAPTLIESELFGHEKGSFTGASGARQGAFSRANGGTLFMDEIGDLALDLQVKLLRVIQEREVQPVGANGPIKVDVRIIAATHSDLEAKIASGSFRLDLYQRLNVLNLSLPALSERKEDIALLTTHFLKKFNSSKRFSHEAIFQLEKYDWPGNVRELENLVQRLCILTDDEEIKKEHLPSDFFAIEEKTSSSTSFNFSVPHSVLLDHLQTLEREYLIFHLSKAKSIRDAAHNHMKMSPSTLRDRMGFHKIIYKPNGVENDSDSKKGHSDEATV